MHILVVGGTRFIGPAAVRHLTKIGHEVTLFHRGKTQADLLSGVKHILGERQRLADFVGELKRLAPDVVLDMFPITEQDARAMMNVFKGIARRIVAISSMDVYRAYGRLIGTEPGPLEPTPLTEDSPLREKLYPYRGKIERLNDYDKIPVERAVLSDPNLPGTVLRLPMVYGPGDYQHRLFGYLKRMDDRRPAILLDETMARWRTARGYVENVGAAIALAATNDRAAGRIYHVAEPDALSEVEWVQKIGQLADWKGKVVIVPKGCLPVDSHLEQDLVADTSRLRDELGYKESVPQDEALTRTIAWERANPPEKINPEMLDYTQEDAILSELKSKRSKS